MKLVLSTLLAALALPALADVGSSARLTGLRYELVDLAPDDGIAPSIRYTGLSLAESLALFHWCISPSLCQRSQGSFTTPAFSHVVNDERGENSVFAAVSAAGLFARGHYANGSNIGSGNGEYRAEARYQGVLGNPLFVVSANTGVRITGQYTLDAWINPTEVVEPTHSDYGAGAAVFFRSRFLDGPEPLVEIQALSSGQPTSEHKTGELSVLLRNDKDHQATLWGKWGVWSSGQVPIGIPEPSTYVLMLAGLIMVGATVRRRQT
jgi:hypothetical protein